MDEAQAVLDARRFDDPSQGRLFIEEQKPSAKEANGEPQAGTEPQATPTGKPKKTKAANVERPTSNVEH